MKILAVDTSTFTGSVALIDSDRLVAEVLLNSKISHSEKLLPAIESILENAQWTLDDLQGLAIAIGPGSFTGLKIGLSTLKGIAVAKKLPLVGVSSLKVLAHNLSFKPEPVAAILDARRQEVYAGIYQFGKDGEVKEIFSDACLSPKDFCRELKKYAKVWLVGEGAVAYRQSFEEELPKVVCFPEESFHYGRAGVAAHLGFFMLKTKKYKDFNGLSPNYLRAPDARLP